jgi:hypothetical protein
MRNINAMNAYSGMNSLKYLCLLLSLLYLAAGFTGIQAISVTPSGMTISHLSAFGRILALATAFVLALFAYGIHTRARIVWKAGFIYLALGYIYLVVGAVIATYRAALVPSILSFWLPAGLVVLIGGAVTVCCGLWWKRQRSYFL